jgi:SAM-dependent methyltransferase
MAIDELRAVLRRGVGVRANIRRAHYWIDRLPDLLLGMDTSRDLDSDIETPDSFGYQPSPWTTLARLLPRADVSPSDVFVDFGCGKGRVLYLAARYAFRRVVGVELRADIADLARRNLARQRHRFVCRDVEVVTSDARSFPIPDDMTVAYLFNPFPDPVFCDVLGRIRASLERRPRRLRLVYRNPAEHDRIVGAGLREIKRVAIRRTDWTHPVVLYESDAF